MAEIAELVVRRYFDGYLQNVFPEQVKALKHHTHNTIEAHDASDEAHGSVERRFSKLFWMLLGGSMVVGSGLGLAATKLASLLL